MPTFRSLKKIIIKSRIRRFAEFLEQFLTPTPSREKAIGFANILFFNPGVNRRGPLGLVNEFMNPRVRRYGFWKLLSQALRPEPPRSGPMSIVTAFVDAPVYRLQQGGDIIRPRQREAGFLQKMMSGINEFLNAYTHFSDLFARTDILLEIPSDAFKDALERTVLTSRLRIERLTERLIEGSISPREYTAKMIAEIKRVNLAAAMLGIGGLGNVTPDAITAINDRIASELTRLNKFVVDTFGPNLTRDLTTATISPAQFRAYSLRFASAGRASSTVAQTAMMEDLYAAAINIGGRLYMRRVLTPGANHCDDCIAYAEAGWVDVNSGVLPPPGVDCACTSHCLCLLEFALALNTWELPDDIAY